jgi:hypothetical protein
MRSYTRLKSTLGMMGMFGLFIGAFICLNPAWQNNMRLQVIGCVYLGVFGLLLCIRTVLGGTQELMRNTELCRLKTDKSGMALLVVMVILSILIALTLHTQSAATARLMHAHRMQLKSELCTAATEGTYIALQRLSDYKEDVMAGWNPEEPFVEGSFADNIKLTVFALRADQKNSSPFKEGVSEQAAQAHEAKQDGIQYDFDTIAETDKARFRIHCQAQRNNSGQVTIVHWVEQVPSW